MAAGATARAKAIGDASHGMVMAAAMAIDMVVKGLSPAPTPTMPMLWLLLLKHCSSLLVAADAADPLPEPGPVPLASVAEDLPPPLRPCTKNCWNYANTDKK